MIKALFAGLALLGAQTIFGAPVESGFSERVYVGGLSKPTSLAWAPDGSGRLFVTLKDGKVIVIKDGVVMAPAFASFGAIYTASECGLLGLAFDPDYLSNHYVYAFVTVSSIEQRIVRWRDLENVGVDRVNIRRGIPTRAANHDGGALDFGPDGKLYWAVGDLGNKVGVDGDLRSVAAKVSRCNADGSVPWDNPFANGPGGNNDFIWATGFRNPFSLTFQARTGDLWLNVVGSTDGGQTEPHSGPGFEQVFALRGKEDGGYDNFEGNQPEGMRTSHPFERPYAHPVFQYKTGTSVPARLSKEVASAERKDGVLTVATTATHPYHRGQAVTLSGLAELDGTYVLRTISPTGFTAVSAGVDVPAVNSVGSVKPLLIGSCVTGGVFYESSAFPAEYRGDFFHGDLTGGVIMRGKIELKANGAGRLESLPVSYTPFITGARGVVDTSVGPDGALYYLNYFSGEVRRVAFSAAAGLTVTPTAARTVKGRHLPMTIGLASAPSAPVSVGLSTSSPDLVLSTNGLVFTPENWNVAQVVEIHANALLENATVTIDGGAEGKVEVPFWAGEAEHLLDFELTPNDQLVIREGDPSGSFEVRLSGPPPRPLTFSVRRIDGPAVIRVLGGQMIFTANNWMVPRKVSVRSLRDRNAMDDVVTLRVSSYGYSSKELRVKARERGTEPPLFTNSPVLTHLIGSGPYSDQATASGDPEFKLISGPAGLTVSQSGLVTWSTPVAGQHSVRIRAGNGRAPAAEQTYTLSVSE